MASLHVICGLDPQSKILAKPIIQVILMSFLFLVSLIYSLCISGSYIPALYKKFVHNTASNKEQTIKNNHTNRFQIT